MTVRVHVETLIERPFSEVLAYTTAPERDVEWTSGLVEAFPKEPGPLREGLVIERVSRFLGRDMRYTIVVTERSGDDWVDMETSAGPFPMTVRYAWERVGEYTRFSITTSGEPGGFFALAAPAMNIAVRRSIRKDLSNLKAVLEG